MTSQDYVNQALAYGIPQPAIDLFLSGNPGDYSRILSALGPDYAPATYGISVSVDPIAVPTPIATTAGISTVQDSDARISGTGSLVALGTAGPAPLVLVKGNAGPFVPSDVRQPFSIWLIVALAAGAYFLLKD